MCSQKTFVFLVMVFPLEKKNNSKEKYQKHFIFNSSEPSSNTYDIFFPLKLLG